ncbi:hypothetical protein Gpo141_00013314, partial [Globisporangium polare]
MRLMRRQLLIAHGADVNVTDNKGDSPISDAARFLAPQVAEALITAGADVTLIDTAGESVVFAVTSITNISTLELLIQHGAPVNAYTPKMDTPMHAAACLFVEIVQFTIDHGVPVDTVSSRCGTPLNVVVLHGHLDIVRLLLENNASAHGSESLYKTPLLRAAENGRLDTVAELVARGASFDPEAAAEEASQVASRQQANPVASPAAMADLTIENCSAIRPDECTLAAWIKKLVALHPMVHDMAGVCDSLVQHLELFYRKSARLPPKPESISDEQWQLIEATCAVDPSKRMDMAGVVEKLRQFAEEG